jgi:hypothetical protein
MNQLAINGVPRFQPNWTRIYSTEAMDQEEPEFMRSTHYGRVLKDWIDRIEGPAAKHFYSSGIGWDLEEEWDDDNDDELAGPIEE